MYISNDFNSSNANTDFAANPDENRNLLKASVYLRVINNGSVNRELLINDARRIVAGAVTNLNTEHIYIVISTS